MTSNSPVNIAVVGHTNTGKTSLIRTLLRSNTFGTVANAASTTKHVERASILVDGESLMSLYDTPGLEDASALLELLDALQKADAGPLTSQRVITTFLSAIEQYPEFEQESKVLNQGLNSDALLYVIDVRLPLLEKYQDEIRILSKLGKPIIPVFNFVTHAQSQRDGWRKLMINHNLHAVVEFDSVAFDFEAEKRLYQKLQGVLETHYLQIQRVIDARSEAWQQLCEAAVRRVVAMLVRCAVFRVSVSHHGQSEEQGQEQALNSLQESIRQYEQQCLKDLLALFMFSKQDVELLQLPVSEGKWELDLFSANTLKLFGLNAGASALKGAAAGAGLDLMTGGLSLGVATVIGAVFGAGYSTVKRYGKDISAALHKNDWLCADDITIELVYLRAQDLLKKLTHRGHATQAMLTVKSNQAHQLPSEWQQIVKGLRTGQANQDAANLVFWKGQQQLNKALMGEIFSTSADRVL